LQKLREAGLDPSKDLQILNIDIQEQGDIVNAAKGGRWDKVDAFASWDHHIALYESKGLAKVLTSGTALGVVMMSERFIRAHPEAAVNFLAAYKLAYYYYATHQDQANDWFSAAAQGQFDQTILRQVSTIEPNLKASSLQQVGVGLGPEHVATLQAAADFAAQQKLIQAQVDIRNAINYSLTGEAEAKIVGDVQSRISAVR
jgi:ABC-type nitrate/sulfonate/bicarbonate transport system substrate-binding protein